MAYLSQAQDPGPGNITLPPPRQATRSVGQLAKRSKIMLDAQCSPLCTSLGEAGIVITSIL